MEDQQPLKKKNRKLSKNKVIQDFARYSGIAFQMIAIILVATWGGIKLDKLTGFENPVFTIILSLFGVFAAIYITVRDLIK